MLIPLLLMLAGFTCLFAACLLKRIQVEILERERNAAWIAEVLT
jgi:hypothetical protein